MKLHHTLFFFLASFVLFVIFYLSQLGQIVDLKGIDLFRTPHPPHPNIAILAIDNKSLEQIGRWPWSRGIQSELLEKLQETSPQLVAFDVTFSDPGDTAGDVAFAESIKTSQFPIVLATQAVFNRGEQLPRTLMLPLPILRDNPNTSLGIVNIFLSPDGLVRLFPKPLSVNGQTFLPFSFQIAKLLNASFPQSGDYLVDTAGPQGSFPIYAIHDVIDGNVTKKELQGKIVLVGATASDLRDTLLIPGNRQVLAGVEWHANIIDNLLLNRYKTLLPNFFPIILAGAVTFILLLTFNRFSPKKVTFILIGFLILVPLVSFILWQMGYVLFFASTVLLILFYFLAHGFFHWYKAERDKRQIRQTFQHYFSPQIMEAILKDPSALRLGGVKKEITILFSDIRGFTTVTESLDPEMLTSLLHVYFTEMTRSILETDGVVDKFIGDAIMAFWGAPIDQKDQADRAVHAAILMCQRLEKVRKIWKERAGVDLDIGIGINTGVAIVGNMGSDKRFDYTVIGDPVNTAARLEGLNKEHHSNIIISETTKKQLTIEAKSEELGEVKVKGKTKGVKIYKVIP